MSDVIRTGTKRRRESGGSDIPVIKTEVLEPISTEWDTPMDPPTPPIPRSGVEEEEDEEAGSRNVQQNTNAVDISSEPRPSSSNQNNCDRPVIKTEPKDTNEEEVQDEGPRASKMPKMDDNKPVSSFFGFASPATPQMTTNLPNSMKAKIKNQPVILPVKAHYHSNVEEDEYKYAGGKEAKIKTIPMREKEKGSNSDASDDDDVAERAANAQPLSKSRYFQRTTDVYQRFDFKSRKVDATRLAVYEKKDHILNSLEKARVVIVEGFTGCGKTTQIPQYVLDKCAAENRICNIVVTQPRKIAAVSVARRVCFERNWILGSSVVGYQVGMENRTDRRNTLLTFMTTGVLLQKLISQKSMKDFTHIFIDEVHERDLESDFLLLVIKKIMAADTEGREQHVKLILMSATIETKKFADYFVFEGKDGEMMKPHVVKIPYVSRHRIDELYLDDLLLEKTDLLNLVQSNLDGEKATIQEEIYEIAVSCIIQLDDKERQQEPDPRMRMKKGFSKHRGAVLVFLPGMEEIRRMERALNDANKKMIDAEENIRRDPYYYRWVVLPLHSSVTTEEQGRVFEYPGDTYRKIILSTNIAESSVTVPDIAYVMDFCLTKSLCVDKTTNFSTLRMVWAAKSQCVQRKGRTGRVADGKVYRLLPRDFYYHSLCDEIMPEMQRSSLETIILMCKKFEIDTPVGLLGDALDRPNLSGIQKAIANLKEMGALAIEVLDKRTGETKYDTCDGDLTFVGRVMTDLPIPQHCTRLIMLGHCFGVMNEAIIIAAGLSVKNPFFTSAQKQLDTYLEKLNHAKKSFSDLFALYHVYKFWLVNYAESGAISGLKKMKREHSWARGAFVQLSVLREIKSTVELITERLKRLGITDSYCLPPDPDPLDLTQEQGIFLKLAIAGAFYPNYFLRRRPDANQYQREINKELNGKDAFRTVNFTAFPKGHEGKLYAKHIAEWLACGAAIPAVIFEGQKVLATFENLTGDTIGPFSRGIFKAIKRRQQRENLEFRVLGRNEEERALREANHEIGKRRCTPCTQLTNLPPVNVSSCVVRVQHIVSPSQFWVLFEKDFETLKKIEYYIEKHFPNIPLPQAKIAPNAFCLSLFDGVHYRVKILREVPSGITSKCLVYYVDYGNSEWVPSSTLKDFSPGMEANHVHLVPCLAVECRLSELKPNIIHGLHWSEEAVKKMKTFCEKAPRLEFEIYSVLESKINGVLIGSNPDGTQKCSLNDNLKAKDESGKQYGEPAAETYLSMDNHRKRGRTIMMDKEERDAVNAEQLGDPLDLDFMEPPKNNNGQYVRLKGPWSPLEMNFHALIKSGNTKEVRIDNGSVNSVVLDHEPTTPTSRMLVAATVSIAEKSRAVIARESTIMSAVPGILSLVAMIFAPKIELRIDRNQSKYTGILCGCGTTPNQPELNIPVHPDKDMEIVFDTEIDNDDIDRVNLIRFNLNLILRNSRGVNKAQYHKQLRDELIKLLSRPRKKIDEEVWAQEEYVWNRISADFLHTSITDGMTFDHEDIYQPHRKVRLNRVEAEEVVWNLGY